jgi:hypothetical protein
VVHFEVVEVVGQRGLGRKGRLGGEKEGGEDGKR